MANRDDEADGKGDAKRTIEEFDPDDLNPDLSAEQRIAIGNLVLGWGAYDSATTYWLAKALGTALDVASIMFGNQRTDTKLKQLETICSHYGIRDAVTGLKVLRKSTEEHNRVRNVVVHSRCHGFMKSQPTNIVFSKVSHITGQPGMQTVTVVPLQDLIESTRFADASSRKIMEIASFLPPIVLPPQPHELGGGTLRHNSSRRAGVRHS